MKNIENFDNISLKNIIINMNSILDEYGKLNGLKIGFKSIHEDKIYHKTNGQPVSYFPDDLFINFDLKSIIKLNSLFLETISSYLFNIRSKVFEKDLIETIHSKIDDTKYIRVRVSKYFFREEDKGRYKISISVIKKGADKDSDTEIVNINFSKRDIVIFSSLLRTLCSSYLRQSSQTIQMNYIDKETNEVVESKYGTIAKIDNSILIDNVWLHGQELLNIMYTLDQLIYKLNIEKNIENLNSFYRQVKFSREKEILYLHVKKMNGSHEEEYTNVENKDCYIKIPMSGYIMSILFLFLDIDVLRHADFEDDLLDNVEILGTTKTYLGEKVKFHISMKESLMGISIKPKLKDPSESKISLVGRIKEGQFNEENEYADILENYIKKYNANGEKELVPVLSEFQIDLKDQWHKLISALGMAYTREYETEEKDWNLIKFYVINQNSSGRFKYEFTIFSDKNNKAPAVLIIDKFQIKNKEEVFESRFRQPLFEKYIYQLISIILTASEDVEHISLLEDMHLKTMLKYHYKSFKKIKELKKDKEIEYGIKKDYDSIEIGNFTQDNTYSKLNFQDIALLNLSAFFRLTKGYWIPFVGDKIAIGQDGYLTDMYGEVNMEGDNKGSYWATKIFFGTSL